eukprot:m51a1_g14564 hypothetical protein (515) ;mRNA; f:1047700-1049299
MDAASDTQPLNEEFMGRVFPSKPAEKRRSWLDALLAEEFETVGDLRTASDDAWHSLTLPVAVRDTLRRHVTQTETAPASAESPCAAAAREPAGVDRRKITQIDVVVFDVSSSMNARSFDPDPERTRLSVAKVLFHTATDKLVAHELSHALALVLFGDTLEATDFTRDYERFHDKLGDAGAVECRTRLYDAIGRAADLIEAFRAAHQAELAGPEDGGCVARVFCLTDGEDNCSAAPAHKVAARLRSANIVLDAIPVAGENRTLAAMAAATGGLCLRVSQLERGVQLFEREALIRVASREQHEAPRPVSSEAELDALAGTREAAAVEDVQAAVPRAATAATLAPAAVAQAATTASSATQRRIFKEYRDFETAAPEGCHVWINADDTLFWKAAIEGPADTPYVGGTWVLSVQFPADYPFKPPKVRFLTRIYHCNINNDGAVCLDILKDKWSPALTVAKVLAAIRSLLADPNAMDPLDVVKATIYKDDRQRYIREAVECTRAYAMASAADLAATYKLT